MRPFLLGIALLLAGAVAVAGCGGSSAAAVAPAKAAATPTAAAKPATPATTVGTHHTALGTFLVDAQGRTLYLFEQDKTSKSTCDGACAAAWPPLTTTSTAKGTGGVSAAKLGTSKRTDGTTIVTYGGHPLYTYVGDTGPGNTNGQGLDQFGAEWYVVGTGGQKIDKG